MNIEQEARVIAALLRTAGVPELFVADADVEDSDEAVAVHRDESRHGYVFRLCRRQPIMAEVVER